MSHGASHHHQEHSDSIEWNPLSGAIAGGFRGRDHDPVTSDLSSDLSPNHSRSHTPVHELFDENESARHREEEDVRHLDRTSESESTTDSSGFAGGETLAESSATSPVIGPDHGVEPSKTSAERDNGQTIVWKPEKLSTPPPRARFPSQHPIHTFAGEDDDEDDENVGCMSRFWRSKKKMFHLRPYEDDEPSDWWFASTAAPLLAATSAPLANVLSIAALVTSWRMNVDDGNGGIVPDFEGLPFADPKWCYYINLGSLICGFLGNIFLLFNFTGRIRYIVALPMSIILWYLATFLLVSITACMHIYAPPKAPNEIYTQGFWYAVIAAVLYFFSCTVLMVNMWGYFLGHYPQRFELNDHQRTLILQTMLFFVWLAAGGGVFSSIESLHNGRQWGFADGLYFCDVTILTIGFGDLTPGNDLGRGLVFPYSVIGIIMLGLVISSISKFAQEIAGENVVRKHAERKRARTLERTTTDPLELERHEILSRFRGAHIGPISAPFNARRFGRKAPPIQPNGRRSTVLESSQSQRSRRSSVIPAVRKRLNVSERIKLRHHKIRLLNEEKDRFDEMRRIQNDTERFKRYWSLSLSVFAFILLWCVGAIVFWRTEKDVQGMTYFQALYFCYVSLLTIGYGDFAPQSNPGRAFFVVWSLIAVPTMTLLISDMSSTVIETFKRLTYRVADYSVLLKRDAFKGIMDKYPRLQHRINEFMESRARKKRLKEGMPVGDEEDGSITPDRDNDRDNEKKDEELTPVRTQGSTRNNGKEQKRHESGVTKYTADDGRHIHHGSTPGARSLLPKASISSLQKQVEKDERIRGINEAKLAQRLAVAIRAVAGDIKEVGEHEVRYTFEQWAELTRLIRFTSEPADQALDEEADDVIEWDWLGEDSPMMTHVSEPEFVLDRLCESLVRYTRRVERRVEHAFQRGKRRSIVLTGSADPTGSLRNEDDGD